MPRRLVRGKDRAVSPVIATIIIVAVAIVMSIAVAYWVLGLAGTFTRYEKIESAYADYDTSKNCWSITATLRNTGSASATINLILLNGKPLDSYSGAKVYNVTSPPAGNVTDTLKTSGISLAPGDSIKLRIDVPEKYFTSGVSVEVTFHTAAGSDYPKVVVLP
jgi:flagellin-like protein